VLGFGLSLTFLGEISMDQASAAMAQPQTRKSRNKETETPVPGPEVQAAMAANEQNLNALMKANEVLLGNILELTQQVFAFGAARLQENIRMSQSLMSCRDPDQAIRSEGEFFQSSVEQYLDQSGKMLELMSRMTRECWTPLEDRAREVVRDLGER
jgi:phasin family protein